MAKSRQQKKDTGETPRIVGLICNWGAYSGVDTAGVKKLVYPASINLVRLPCLGRLHLGLILRAFELGAAGVLLLGCSPELCHYESGMVKAKEVFAQAEKVLRLLGIAPERLALVEVPAGGGDHVARKILAFVKRINQAGLRQAPTVKKVASPV